MSRSKDMKATYKQARIARLQMAKELLKGLPPAKKRRGARMLNNAIRLAEAKSCS